KKDKVVVKGQFTQTGAAGSNVTTSVDTYPAKVKRGDVDSPTEVATVTAGKETIQMKGEAIESEWVEATVQSGDEITVEKVWRAQTVPGGTVKQTMTKKKGGKTVSDSVLEVVGFK